jgi:hypothetical protein
MAWGREEEGDGKGFFFAMPVQMPHDEKGLDGKRGKKYLERSIC